MAPGCSFFHGVPGCSLFSRSVRVLSFSHGMLGRFPFPMARVSARGLYAAWRAVDATAGPLNGAPAPHGPVKLWARMGGGRVRRAPWKEALPPRATPPHLPKHQNAPTGGIAILLLRTHDAGYKTHETSEKEEDHGRRTKAAPPEPRRTKRGWIVAGVVAAGGCRGGHGAWVWQRAAQLLQRAVPRPWTRTWKATARAIRAPW